MKPFSFGKVLAALFAVLYVSGCGPPKWVIQKWGEDQYMSYRIDARNLSLFTYPRMSYPYTPEGVRTAVSRTYETILSKKGPKSLVVFIHGRGKYPEKAYGTDRQDGQDILRRIESEYGAKVLMFHWPSWLAPWGYPSRNAEESGAHLRPLLDALCRYRQQNPAKAGEVKTTLLIHSMGAQVLKRFLTGYDGGFASGPPLFDSVVLNAPDVDLVGHRNWLDRIDFARDVYVTVNPGRDELLKFSYYLLGTPRLGRSLTREDGTAESLAGRAAYVDVSAAGVNHDYYIGRGRPENLAAFYRNVIGNTGVDPLKGPGVSETDRPRVYTVSP